jgi:hypothetical protein
MVMVMIRVRVRVRVTVREKVRVKIRIFSCLFLVLSSTCLDNVLSCLDFLLRPCLD